MRSRLSKKVFDYSLWPADVEKAGRRVTEIVIIVEATVFVPFEGGLLGAKSRFSSGLAAESTVAKVGSLLTGASYTYEPAPPMLTPGGEAKIKAVQDAKRKNETQQNYKHLLNFESGSVKLKMPLLAITPNFNSNMLMIVIQDNIQHHFNKQH